MNHFSNRLRCVTKNRFYTTSNDQLSGWTEKLQRTFQSQTCTKMRSWSLVWRSAPGLIYHSFLNPKKTTTSESYAQQIDEKHQKLQWLQPALVNRMGPILLQNNGWLQITQPMLQKLNELGYEVLPLPLFSPDLLPTNYHFFKHLDSFISAGKTFLQPARGRKCFPRVCWIPKHEFLHYRNKQILLVGKMW